MKGADAKAKLPSGAFVNARWELYAQGVAAGKSYLDAYIDAGYSKKNASTHASALYKQYPEIKDRVEQIRAEMRAKHEAANKAAMEELKIDKAYVLRAAFDTLEIALGRRKVNKTRSMSNSKEVGVDSDGKPIKKLVIETADYQAYSHDLPVAAKTVELFGREHGMFIETKIHKSGPLDSVPPEELANALDVINAAIQKGEAAASGQAGKPAAADPKGS